MQKKKLQQLDEHDENIIFKGYGKKKKETPVAIEKVDLSVDLGTDIRFSQNHY